MNSLERRVRRIGKGEDFESLALDIFRYQYENVPIYHSYVNELNRSQPTRIEEIPFLPIQFFKSHQIISRLENVETVFKSSGTGGQRSQHFVASKKLYEFSFNAGFQELIGDPEHYVILALLPNYIEQGESSLVYMVDHLIEKSNNRLSGFCLDKPDEIITRYQQAIQLNKKVIIFGVSYALLDLCDLKPDLSEATIIETGGMKGRRKEMTKHELHEELKSGLNCHSVSSEYGMTELLSQGYSLQNGVFECASTMRIYIRDVNDPFTFNANGKSGGINVIDLANLYSCSFIETQDLGKQSKVGFEILGRIDQAEQRGCNLMVE